MDQIDLPSIDADASLNDAIYLMKEKGCSGVLVELPSGPIILDVDVILHTLREEGNLNIGAVRPRVATVSLPSERSAEEVLSTESAWINAQRLMDSGRAVYAVASIVGGTAHVLTRHEPYKYALEGVPTMWRCRMNPDHVWLTEDLMQPGEKCRNDGSGVDSV